MGLEYLDVSDGLDPPWAQDPNYPREGSEAAIVEMKLL